MESASKLNTVIAPDFITKNVNTLDRIEVVVIGAGGTGSQVLAKLFQLNNIVYQLTGQFFKVKVYDPDNVSNANIGRQAFYPFDIGKNKAEVLVNRFTAFSEQPWEAHPYAFISEEKGHDLNSRSIVFGCVDTIRARKTIHNGFSKGTDCIWIDCGNNANSANIIMGVNANVNNTKVYLPTVYDLYRHQMNTQPDNNSESCSTEEAITKQDFGINDIAATYAVQMFWRLLRHGSCDYQGVQVDLKSGTTNTIAPDPDLWAMYGWEAPNH